MADPTPATAPNIDNPNHKDYLEPLAVGVPVDPAHPSHANAVRLHKEGKLRLYASGPRVRTVAADGTVTDTTPMTSEYHPKQLAPKK